MFVALTGLLGGLNIPAWQAYVPSLVPREDLLSAVTLNSLQFNAARALGPAVAGLVLHSLGPSWAFLFNAISFGFVLAVLVMIRPKVAVPMRTGAASSGFIGALRYTVTQPGIVTGILIALLIGFFGNPVIQFAVVYAKEVYLVGDVAYGFLVAGLGIGAALAAPLVSGWNLSRKLVVQIAFPAYGLACAVFGFSTSYWVGLGALAVAGAGLPGGDLGLEHRRADHRGRPDAGPGPGSAGDELHVGVLTRWAAPGSARRTAGAAVDRHQRRRGAQRRSDLPGDRRPPARPSRRRTRHRRVELTRPSLLTGQAWPFTSVRSQ